MAVDPAALDRRGNHWLVALVEQSEWNRNDGNAKYYYSCGFDRRYNANSIDANANADQINAVPGTRRKPDKRGTRYP